MNRPIPRERPHVCGNSFPVNWPMLPARGPRSRFTQGFT